MKLTKVFIIMLALLTLLASCTPQEPDNLQAVSEEIAIGEGENSFELTVTLKDGSVTKYTVSTDKTIVGEALIELGLIAGDQGDYGLYVKTVDGETLDYDTDKMYWAFYINGEYAMSGVDTTPVAEGESYAFKAEK